ncbi:hypothetical protein, partial [uncultured Chryseobacterium sp.]|uniref:hypothetical protein n=1 Tax=uncultured Chryseobacterium sp. TaxID=259322 RepID=UPI0025F7DC39
MVSRNIQKASPNVNMANPMHHPDSLQSNTPERKAARPPKVKAVPEKPKPRPDSPKFPVTIGGESRSDDREKLLHAGFVDAAGNRLHSSRVGSTAVMKITARNMNHKKVRVKVWEQDNLLWTHDLIYDSSWILTGDENYIRLQLTKKMFDKGRDGGTDRYVILAIHIRGISNIYGHAIEYYDTDRLVKYGFTKIGTDLNSRQLKKSYYSFWIC